MLIKENAALKNVILVFVSCLLRKCSVCFCSITCMSHKISLPQAISIFIISIVYILRRFQQRTGPSDTDVSYFTILLVYRSASNCRIGE
jgi:hypothetical protein